MRRFVVLLAVTLLIGVGVVRAPAGPPRVRLVVGVPMAAQLFMPPYLAIEKGFFLEEGLEVEMREFVNGPITLLHMAQNEFPMAIHVGWSPMFQAVAGGLDMRILMSTGKDNAPVVAAAHIREFRDLDGKTVGTPGLGTIQNTMLNLAAKRFGVKFGKLIHARVVDLPLMLEKGEVDAFTAWEYVAADAVYRVLGAHYVLRKPVIPDAESVGFAVRTDFYERNRDIVRRFVRGYMKGLKYFKDNRREAIKWAARAIGRPESVVELGLGSITIDRPLINLPTVVIQVQDAIETGRIKKEVVGANVEDWIRKYIDMSITQQVMREMGL
jgi:NitT/TauT family transport system substrate-binding protein